MMIRTPEDLNGVTWMTQSLIQTGQWEWKNTKHMMIRTPGDLNGVTWMTQSLIQTLIQAGQWEWKNNEELPLLTPRLLFYSKRNVRFDDPHFYLLMNGGSNSIIHI